MDPKLAQYRRRRTPDHGGSARIPAVNTQYSLEQSVSTRTLLQTLFSTNTLLQQYGPSMDNRVANLNLQNGGHLHPDSGVRAKYSGFTWATSSPTWLTKKLHILSNLPVDWLPLGNRFTGYAWAVHGTFSFCTRTRAMPGRN